MRSSQPLPRASRCAKCPMPPRARGPMGKPKAKPLPLLCRLLRFVSWAHRVFRNTCARFMSCRQAMLMMEMIEGFGMFTVAIPILAFFGMKAFIIWAREGGLSEFVIWMYGRMVTWAVSTSAFRLVVSLFHYLYNISEVMANGFKASVSHAHHSHTMRCLSWLSCHGIAATRGRSSKPSDCCFLSLCFALPSYPLTVSVPGLSHAHSPSLDTGVVLQGVVHGPSACPRVYKEYLFLSSSPSPSSSMFLIDPLQFTECPCWLSLQSGGEGGGQWL